MPKNVEIVAMSNVFTKLRPPLSQPGVSVLPRYILELSLMEYRLNVEVSGGGGIAGYCWYQVPI